MLSRSARNSLSLKAGLISSNGNPPAFCYSKSFGKGVSTYTGPSVDFGKQYVNQGLNRLLPNNLIVKGEGSYVVLENDRRMLDFTCGIGVTNLGHCHPKVSKAAAEQCMTLVHGQTSIGLHPPYLKLVERLIPVMPHPSLNSFFFWNSGAEAVEGAVKMARQLTNKQNVIVMQGSFHGRTFGSASMTRSKTIYAEGAFPLMPGVFQTTFPYWHQQGLSKDTSTEELVKNALYQLDLLLAQSSSPRDTAAILVEPVLGEGGYVPAPTEFLKALRIACDKHNMILIFDEVQCGFGRTGKYFASEYSGVKPDIMVTAKGIANGFPLSAIIANKEFSDKLKTKGGTYAGNAVSCAAGVACAEVMQEENILGNVEQRSKELFAALSNLQSDTTIGPNILDVRGLGLMVAVEFASPSASLNDPFLKPSAPKNLASRVAKRCIDKGLLILTTSAYEVIRFIPPLNISHEDMAKGCEIFTEAVKEVLKEG